MLEVGHAQSLEGVGHGLPSLLHNIYRARLVNMVVNIFNNKKNI